MEARVYPMGVKENGDEESNGGDKANRVERSQ